MVGSKLGSVAINSQNSLRESTCGFGPSNLHSCGIGRPVSRVKLQVIGISTEGCTERITDGRVGPGEDVLQACPPASGAGETDVCARPAYGRNKVDRIVIGKGRIGRCIGDDLMKSKSGAIV